MVGWMASNSFGVVERPALPPRRGRREVAGRPPLHVHHPPRVLGARPGEQVPARELDGLGADRAEDPVRQPDRVRPRAPLVGGGAREAPPLARAGADLVEEQQGAPRRLEEHGVPAGVAGAVGLASGRDLDRCGPAAVAPPRHPDADVGVPFLRAGEPRGEEPVPRLHDRGGVGRAEGGALGDELRGDDRGRRVPRGREVHGEQEDDHSPSHPTRRPVTADRRAGSGPATPSPRAPARRGTSGARSAARCRRRTPPPTPRRRPPTRSGPRSR